MRTAIINFLTMKPEVVTTFVWWIVGLAWLLLLSCCIASVVAQVHHAAWKILWIVVLVALPLFGAFFYSAYCIVTADFRFMRLFGVRSKARQLNAVQVGID